jgi:hypothetical protein
MDAAESGLSWAGLVRALGTHGKEEAWSGQCGELRSSPLLTCVVRAYVWGSRVYGTARPNSDWDVLCVTTTTTPPSPSEGGSSRGNPREGGEADGSGVDGPYALYDDGLLNVSFYSLPQWIAALREHRHDAVECCFLPPQHVQPPFPQIRHT